MAVAAAIGICLLINRWHGLGRIASVGLLVVIICAIPWLFRWTKDQAIDRYLGELSYPLYICHVAVIWWTDSFVSLRGVPRGILIVGAALALSALLYAWVDRPVDRWRQMRLEARPVRLAPSPGSG
jgi:peptidoglycan/LPS O-acetylase OafA/YrhL